MVKVKHAGNWQGGNIYKVTAPNPPSRGERVTLAQLIGFSHSVRHSITGKKVVYTMEVFSQNCESFEIFGGLK